MLEALLPTVGSKALESLDGVMPNMKTTVPSTAISSADTSDWITLKTGSKTFNLGPGSGNMSVAVVAAIAGIAIAYLFFTGKRGKK